MFEQIFMRTNPFHFFGIFQLFHEFFCQNSFALTLTGQLLVRGYTVHWLVHNQILIWDLEFFLEK